MALPNGVTVCSLSFGPYLDAEGDVQYEGMVGFITPSSPVRHIATGAVIVSQPVKVVIGQGGVGSVVLPQTDQAGIAPSPFTYTLAWQAGRFDSTPGNLTFALPTAAGSTVDYDTLAPTPAGVSVPSFVTSVNGQTGAVVIAGGGGGGAVASVNAKTGTVVLSASDVGADAAGAATAAQAFAIQRANHTGTQAASTVTGLATVATTGAYADLSAKPAIPTVGAAGAGAGVALSATDASVTNSRTPTTHAATHASGGSDPVTVTASQVTGLGTAATQPSSAFDAAGAAATAQGASAQKSANLSDLANAATARTNLGLATVASTGSYTDLSNKPTAVAGVRRSGYSIPAGSLANWDAARAAAATTHADVVCLGDSTTEGILNSGGNGAGWVPTLRSLSVAAGVTDGGRGQIDGIYDSTVTSGESFGGFVSRTGWAAANTNTPPGPNPFSSTTVGDVLTLQYKTPANAMRVRASSNSSTGRLTVAVNGTTVGTVDPAVPGQTYGEIVKTFTGLTAGGTGQTVTVTNTGGAPLGAPTQFRTAGSATTGGAVTPGSYTYATTFVDTSGRETALGPAASITVPAGTSTNTVTTAMDNSGGTSYVPAGIAKARLYRASGSGVSNPSSFQLVLEQTSTGGAQIVMIDVGNAPGVTAPTSGNANATLDPANGGPKAASIAVDFYDSTKGITYHKAGYSGQKYVTSFNPAGQPLSAANFDTQTHLGLQTGLGGSTPAWDWTVIPDTSGNQRKPALAICAYGINDMNLAASATDIAAVQNGVATFIRFCRAAGCDPLVVIPHLEYAVNLAQISYLAQVRDAILNTADAHGAAWVDFSRALPPFNATNNGTYGGVHLTQAGYDAEATYLWNNVLSASASR